MTTDTAIQTMLDRIVQQFDPVRVILFGSHARGSASSESDIDLLVVLDEVRDKRQTTIEIRRVLGDLPVSKDIIVTTPDEIARRGHLVGSGLRPALDEGKVLYERSRASVRAQDQVNVGPMNEGDVMTHTLDSRDPILTEILRRLVESCQPERIYLFGSKARNEAGADSDYDLLVIVSESDLPPHRRDQQAYRALRGVGAAKDVLVWTRKEFESRVGAPTSLPATVLREGILLYAA